MMLALNLWSVALLVPCAFYVIPEFVGTVRHCLCLVCSTVFVAMTVPFLADFQETLEAIGLEEQHRMGAGWQAAEFFRRHPDALVDMLAFCVAGAIGQVHLSPCVAPCFQCCRCRRRTPAAFCCWRMRPG